MTPLPFVLLPGLLCSPRLFADQLPLLWRLGPVTIADTTRDDTLPAMARRVLADAPPRFGLLGLSMGGYLAFEILRQAPQRVARLVLLDTSARPDTPEATQARLDALAQTRAGRFDDVLDASFPLSVHPARHHDEALRGIVRAMAYDTGTDAFARQQHAIIARADARPLLPSIACPTLVMVGDRDGLTPPDRAEEIASGIPGARLVVLADCGHIATLEQPEQVRAALRDWLPGA